MGQWLLSKRPGQSLKDQCDFVGCNGYIWCSTYLTFILPLPDIGTSPFYLRKVPILLSPFFVLMNRELANLASVKIQDPSLRSIYTFYFSDQSNQFKQSHLTQSSQVVIGLGFRGKFYKYRLFYHCNFLNLDLLIIILSGQKENLNKNGAKGRLSQAVKNEIFLTKLFKP